MEIKINKVDLIIILIMFLCIIIGVAFYYVNTIQECTSNPLVYGAKAYEEKAGYEFVGIGFFKTPIEIRSPTINFNSKNISFSG